MAERDVMRSYGEQSQHPNHVRRTNENTHKLTPELFVHSGTARHISKMVATMTILATRSYSGGHAMIFAITSSGIRGDLAENEQILQSLQHERVYR
jgi:hypothetical protein